MKPQFKFTVLKDSSKVEIYSSSENISEQVTTFDGITLKLGEIEDDFKCWFVVRLDNKSKYIDTVKEIVNYVEVTNEDDRCTTVTYINGGMALVEFEVPLVELSNRIGLDIVVKSMPDGKYYFNTQYLKNTFCDYRYNKIDGVSQEINIYPYPDFKIDDLEYEMNYITKNITITDDKHTIFTPNISGDIFLKGESISDVPTVKPTYKVIPNSDDYTFTPDEVVEGVPTDIIISYDEELFELDTFNSVAKVPTEMGFDNRIKISKDGVFKNITSYGDVKLEVSLDRIVVDNSIPISFDLVNCSVDYSENTVEKGQEYTFTFTADDGYSFESLMTFTMDNITRNITPTGKKLFSYKIVASGSSDFPISFELSASEDIEVDNEIINTFRLTNEQYQKLSKLKMIKTDGSEIDYSPFVLKSYIYPMFLSEDLFKKERNIIVGDYDTTIKAIPLNKNVVSFNLGSIKVDEKYNNIYDYINTQTNINIPYHQPIQLDYNMVIGYTISVEYVVDFYTGDVTVNIHSTCKDTPIYSDTFNPTTPIPLFTNVGTVSNGIGTKTINDVNRVSLEVIRNIPYNIKTPFGSEVLVYEQLKNCTGFIKVENIILDSNATSSEKEKIISMLKNGVDIK